jgi:WD40 repeat protein
VFAGLIPNLRKDKNNQWQIVSFRPGKNPFKSLAEALVSALSCCDDKSHQIQENLNSKRERERELEKQLRHNNSTLQTTIEKLVAPSARHFQASDLTFRLPRFLLVADQFEELYTLCIDAEERKRFLEGLLNAVQYTPLFTLVVTLRADFLERSLDYAPFGKALQDYPPEFLIPMNREELESAIALPSQKLNVRLEAGLTEAIVQEVGDSRGNLPMLEFALAQLWEKQQTGWLTHQAYYEIGGALKALTNHAEAVYARLDKRQREIAQQVFIQLVQPGEGTEDTRKLATRLEVGESNWDLVTLLASERLVVTNCDRSIKIETVEIVHEALIRNWGRLRQWINTNREFRTWQERLKMTWQQWETTSFDKDALLRGASLVEAEEWLQKRFKEISPAQREFIKQGVKLREEKKQRQEQRKRRTILGLSGGLVLALSLAGEAAWQWQKAANEQITSVSISSSALLKSDRDLDALLEAIKAARQLKSLVWANSQTRKQVYLSLQEAVYNVKERNRLESSNDAFNRVDVSPDGKTIVSVNQDRKLALWSRDGRQLKTFVSHEGEYGVVGISSDGRTIASANYDGTIKLWSINGQELRRFKGKGVLVDYISFSPDGKIIASSYKKSNKIDLWSVDGRWFKSLDTHSSYNSWGVVKFSPDGKIIASVNNAGKGRILKLWRVDGRELKTFTITDKTKDIDVWDISFSPDGKKIATADTDGTVTLWNLSGQKLRTIVKYSSIITSVRFSPDGKTIAASSADGIIKLWSLNGQELKTFKGHVESVTSLSFSPDGTSLISGSRDRAIKIWEIDNQDSKTFMDKNLPLRDVRFSPDGKIIATVDQNDTIILWNLKGQKLKNINSSNNNASKWNWNKIGFSPNGKMLASMSGDKTIKLWSLNGQNLKTFKGHDNIINDVSFSSDGKLLASASEDRTIRLWNLDGRLLKTLTRHRSGVWSVSFSPDGKTIASADNRGTIAIWNLQGQMLKMFQGHSSLASVSFSPDGKTIVSGSADKTIKLWSLDGQEIKTFRGHSGGVSSVRFSSDGELIASSSVDGTIALWSVKSGEQLKTIKGNGYPFWNLSFSPDGKTIASVSDNGLLQLWSTEILDLDRLIGRGCNWLHDYLKNNNSVSDRDRHVCEGI